MNNQGIGKIKGIMALIIALIIISLTFTMILGPQPFINFNVTITPTIYSSENNIGVLNEIAIFEMRIWNGMLTPEDLVVILTADDELILNTTIRIDADSSRNETITQRLSDIGMWKVKAIHNQETVDSYSFKTLTNKNEADDEITKPTLSLIQMVLGIAGSIVGIIVAVIGIWYKRKQKTKPNYPTTIDY